MRLIFLIALSIFIFPFSGTAYAYLDQGTGSYIFQLSMAALVGGLFAVKLFWNKVISFFKGLFAKKHNKNG